MGLLTEKAREYLIRELANCEDLSYITEARLLHHFHFDKDFIDFLVGFYELKGKKILEYATGTGVHAKMFSKYSDNVSTCDFTKGFREFAKINWTDINIFEEDFYNSNLSENEYDFLFCRSMMPLETLEFSRENEKYLRKLMKSLRPGGIAYYLLLGNSNNDISSIKHIKNHNWIDTINFFKNVGYIAMVNGGPNGKVIVLSNEFDTSFKYHQKMFNSIMYRDKIIIQDILINGIEIANDIMWLYMNTGISHYDLVESNAELNNMFKKTLNIISNLVNQYGIPKGALEYLYGRSSEFKEYENLYYGKLYFLDGYLDKLFENSVQKALWTQ